MPVSKRRKHPGKRNRIHAKPSISGTLSVIYTPVLLTPNELATLNLYSTDYYKFGRRDNEKGVAALSLNGFIEEFGLLNMGREHHSDLPYLIAQAQYEQYMDGYRGATFCNIEFREVGE